MALERILVLELEYEMILEGIWGKDCPYSVNDLLGGIDDTLDDGLFRQLHLITKQRHARFAIA